MADKRIWELTTSTVKTGKYLAIDSNAQVAAHKFDAGALIDNFSTESIGGIKTFSANTVFQAVVTMSGLASDDTEDHLVAIDDSTGLLTKRAANTIKPTLGLSGEIPFVNGAATDFQYSAAVSYLLGIVKVPNLQVSAIASGLYNNLVYAAPATGQLGNNNNLNWDGTYLNTPGLSMTGASVNTIETTLTNDNTHIATSGAIFAAIAAVPTQVLTLGANDEIPYMTGTTDFEYSANFKYTNAALVLSANYDQVGVMEVTSTLTDVGTWNSGSVSGYGRIVVNQSAGGDTQLGFQSNASTKWSIGNESTGDSFKISKGFGAFGTDDFLTIYTTGLVEITDGLHQTSADIHGILIHRNASTSDIVTGYLRFESDTVGRYSEISGYRFTDSNEQGINFWTYDTGFQQAMTLGPEGCLALNDTPSAEIQLKIKVRAADSIGFYLQNNYSAAVWTDFATAVPNRTVYIVQQDAVGAANNYTSVSITCRTSPSYIAFANLAVIGDSASNNNSTFAVNLRYGTGTTDYRTPFKVSAVGTIYFQAKNTTEDITVYYRQGATAVVTSGWDDSAASYVIAIGTTFTSTGRWQFGESSSYYYGSAAANLYLDAATGNAALYLRADTTDDPVIYFQQNTSTRYIMGYDDTYDNFQIHSSTSFSTSADFQISISGAVGLGVAPHATNRLYIYDSYTSAVWYGIRIYSDGNSTNAQGIFIQAGLDTLTSSDNTYLWCADGNGTTVGTLLADTTSFRLFNAVSSRDYKADIRPIENVMEKFKNPLSQPKRYKYIGRSDEEKADIRERGINQEDLVGFIIEDLEVEFPDAVKRIKDENGNIVPMYSDTTLIPYLVKALVELSDRIDSLTP